MVEEGKVKVLEEDQIIVPQDDEIQLQAHSDILGQRETMSSELKNFLDSKKEQRNYLEDTYSNVF